MCDIRRFNCLLYDMRLCVGCSSLLSSLLYTKPNYFAHRFMHETYQPFLDSGFMMLMEVNATYYPTLDHLKLNFNDPVERVRWRSKQSLDYAFMFHVGSLMTHGYYMQVCHRFESHSLWRGYCRTLGAPNPFLRTLYLNTICLNQSHSKAYHYTCLYKISGLRVHVYHYQVGLFTIHGHYM